MDDKELEDRFWSFWGIAPNGIETLAFIKEELEVVYQVAYDEGHANGWDERGKLND